MWPKNDTGMKRSEEITWDFEALEKELKNLGAQILFSSILPVFQRGIESERWMSNYKGKANTMSLAFWITGFALWKMNCWQMMGGTSHGLGRVCLVTAWTTPSGELQTQLEGEEKHSLNIGSAGMDNGETDPQPLALQPNGQHTELSSQFYWTIGSIDTANVSSILLN